MDVELYFGLDEMGTRMWQVLTASPTIQDAYSALLAEFDVDEATLRHDISEFLGKLTEKGLLRISSANFGSRSGIAVDTASTDWL